MYTQIIYMYIYALGITGRSENACYPMHTSIGTLLVILTGVNLGISKQLYVFLIVVLSTGWFFITGFSLIFLVEYMVNHICVFTFTVTIDTDDLFSFGL